MVNDARRKLIKGILFILASAVCWGFSGACIQYVTQVHGVSTEWVNTLRMACSMVILLPICLARRSLRIELRSMCTNPRDLRASLLFAVFGAFCCQIGYCNTIALTDAGIGTMLEALGLVLVMLWTCLREHRAPRPFEIIGLVLALFGIFCICTQGNLHGFALPPAALFWGAFSMVAYASYILLPVALLRRYSGTAVTAFAMTVATVVSFIVYRPWTTAFPICWGSVLGVLGTAIFGTAIAYILFLKGEQLTSAVIASLCDSFEPVAALLIGVFWLNNVVTGWSYMGCVAIIGMIVFLSLSPTGDGATLTDAAPNPTAVAESETR